MVSQTARPDLLGPSLICCPWNPDLLHGYFDQYIWLLEEYAYHHLWNDLKVFIKKRFVKRFRRFHSANLKCLSLAMSFILSVDNAVSYGSTCPNSYSQYSTHPCHCPKYLSIWKFSWFGSSGQRPGRLSLSPSPNVFAKPDDKIPNSNFIIASNF